VTSDPYPDLCAGDLPEPAAGAEPPELDEADSRLLAALSRPAPPVVTAVEDEPRRARPAGEDPGAPLSGARGPLTPVFREPG
jgi:hypothetical protein